MFGGWRDEINIPGVTQLKPDGLVRGSGRRSCEWYSLEYERSAIDQRIKENAISEIDGVGYDILRKRIVAKAFFKEPWDMALFYADAFVRI